MTFSRNSFVLLVYTAVAPMAAHACATCGCSLSADAAMGYSTMPGWRMSLDYSFINQNQLRHGTGAVPATQAAAINDAGGSQEVEKQTINRYYNLGLTYSPNNSWSFSTIVPVVDRSHTTYGNAPSDQLTPDNVSGVTASGLGDVRLIGTYQGFLPTRNFGVQLGVKLPTGAYGGHTIDFREYADQGIILTGKMLRAEAGVVEFADDLAGSLAGGDAAYGKFLDRVDAHAW